MTDTTLRARVALRELEAMGLTVEDLLAVGSWRSPTRPPAELGPAERAATAGPAERAVSRRCERSSPGP
jgi:hypothetical protein